jgi:hypothetical protein
MVQLLFAPEIFLGSLNRRMTKQELDLIQFSSGNMAESCARTAQIVWSEVLNSGLASRGFDDMPDCFRRDSFSPYLSESAYSAKDWTLVGTGCASPIIHGSLRPRGHRNGANMFPFADYVRQNPTSSRSWKSSFLNFTGSARRGPQAINNARIARSRLPRRVSTTIACSRSLVCSTLSQFPILTPNRLAPLTRRMPAASSGLSRPVSDASYASLRTAARRTLIVEGAKFFCSRKNR